jgi:hypothetical protein
MSSFTEELLVECLKDLKTGAEALTLKLDVTKLDISISAINNVLGFEKKIKTLTFRTAVLDASGKARQERKQATLGELYACEVLADLVKARDLRAELDRLFQDLESFKAKRYVTSR